MEYWAHSGRGGAPDQQGSGHLLADHLRAVATLASGFSEPFDSGQWGHLAGLWHDLGKYRAGFQRYVRQTHDPMCTSHGLFAAATILHLSPLSRSRRAAPGAVLLPMEVTHERSA